MENYFEQFGITSGAIANSPIGDWELVVVDSKGLWKLIPSEVNAFLFKTELSKPFIETEFVQMSQKQIIDQEFAKNHPEGVLGIKFNLNILGHVTSWSTMPIIVEQEYGSELKEKYLQYCEGYVQIEADVLQKYGQFWMDNAGRRRRKISNFPQSIDTTPTDPLPVKSLEQVLATNSPKAIVDAIRAKGKLTPDEAIDVGKKAHELRSNLLLNLLKQVPIKESIEPFKNFYNEQLICEKTGTTSYGCLMAVLPKEKQSRFISFAKSHIDKENLADDGYENESHVTVLYGFHGDLSKQLKSLLHKWGDIEFTLSKISRFKSKDKDVIKVEAESEDIKKLHGFLMEHYKEEITTDFPKWKGHLTLAYVKPGAHKELDGDTTFDGKKYKFQELIYSTPGMHKKTKISLTTD